MIVGSPRTLQMSPHNFHYFLKKGTHSSVSSYSCLAQSDLKLNCSEGIMESTVQCPHFKFQVFKGTLHSLLELNDM